MTELIRTLQRGNAANAAANFGKAEVGLQAGHAYGQNIVAGFSEVPTLDLAPVYVRLGGIEGGFLMDATSYAWDAQGLVVSSDLMLLGVTGWYGAAPPASSWLRLPVPSAGLQQTPEPLLETAAKANSIAIPNGFNPADPASVAAALALLPANGSDTFSKVQPDNLGLIGPSLEIELLDVSTGASVVAVDYNYALVLPAESFSLATGGVAVVVDTVASVPGTGVPILGAEQVTPTSVATDAGWTLLFNGTEDEGSVGVAGFPFAFTLAGQPYTSCFVTSNAYLTFGAVDVEYQELSATVPALPKLHIGSGDFSYQRVYAKIAAGTVRVRWEGNSSWSAAAGSSNRFLEVAFFQGQFIEVRSGSISGATTGPFMLATASTALATGAFAANESWVFSGNTAGTVWSLQQGYRID